MKKLKPLSPTLRERKRYVVYEVISKHPIKFGKSIALKAGASFIDDEVYIQAGIGILTRNW